MSSTTGMEFNVGEAAPAKDLAKSTLAVVLAGGSGKRLKALTRWHTKPALPVAGNYRNIDFPLSNCINSGIRQVGVLTQYKAHTLIQHLNRAWNFLQPEIGEFIELWPAQQRCQDDWYTGTSNAVYQNLDIIGDYDPEYVLVLAGDHVYKMDYIPMLRRHVTSGADVTVGCISVSVTEADQFGIVCGGTGDGEFIEDFIEKPAVGSPYADDQGHVMASMGIYVFSTRFLHEALTADEANPGSDHDFGHNVIPAAVRNARACAYLFRSDRACGNRPYWRDVGTLDAYWQSHMELLGESPPLDLNDRTWPIRSYRESLPPARFIYRGEDAVGVATQSMVADGCVLDGAMVLGSVLFANVQLDVGAQVTEAVILPQVVIGKRCRLHRVIIESGCVIPDDTVIGEDPIADARRFYLSDRGVVLVTHDALRRPLPGRVQRAKEEALTRVA
jgi:glucose-1-phosphate adenylyltransferase